MGGHASLTKYDYFGEDKKCGEVERLPRMKHAKVNVDVICHDEKALYPMADNVFRIRQSAPMKMDVLISTICHEITNLQHFYNYNRNSISHGIVRKLFRPRNAHKSIQTLTGSFY